MSDDDLIRLALLMREAQKRAAANKLYSNKVAAEKAEEAFDRAALKRAGAK